MKHITKLRVLGITLLILGVLGTLPSQYMWLQQKHAVASQSSVVVPAVAEVPEPSSTLIVGRPSQISIPSLGLDLPVLNGEYNQNTGNWTLSEKNTHYALPSILPNNESGNTLIYGHYNKYVFGKLHTVALGAEAIITTTDGHKFIYSYMSSESASPTDVNVLLYEGPARLTLQTCSGSFMQNRQMHYFSFVRYE